MRLFIEGYNARRHVKPFASMYKAFENAAEDFNTLVFMLRVWFLSILEININVNNVWIFTRCAQSESHNKMNMIHKRVVLL